MIRGKIVILGMMAVALSMAVFAWWARYSGSRQVLAAFGPQVAAAVRNGEQVELLALAADPGGVEEAEVIASNRGDTLAYVTERRDISRVLGLIHARHHLLHHRGFQWDKETPVAGGTDTPTSDASTTNSNGPNWTIALRFTHDTTTATWLFDFQQQRAHVVECEKEIGIAPIAPSLKTFLDQIPSPSSASSARQ